MSPQFQNIPDDQFDLHSDFVVKESRGVNIVYGLFFFILSVAFASQFSISWFWVFPIFSIGFPAIAAIVKGVKHRTIMVINKKGFYYYGKLITDWQHYIDVEFIDNSEPEMTDLFYFMIRYYKDNEPGYYGRKIRFTDSQNKAEEEIIAAIKFYAKNCKEVIQ
jgi:hypothetical protein